MKIIYRYMMMTSVLALFMSNSAFALCLINKNKDVMFDILELNTNINIVNWVAEVSANGATSELGLHNSYPDLPALRQDFGNRIHSQVSKLAAGELRMALHHASEVFSKEVYPPFWTEKQIIPFTSPTYAFYEARNASIHGHRNYSTFFSKASKVAKEAIQDGKLAPEIAFLTTGEAWKIVEKYAKETKKSVRKSVKCRMLIKKFDKNLVLDIMLNQLKTIDYLDIHPKIRAYYETQLQIIERKLLK